jgi:hypothetical protein
MPFEVILNELRKKIAFKENTAVGDIVLVGMKPGLFYGLVLDIKPDVKKNWWDVTFKLLIIPPVDITWILRIPQMNGEIFTINGEEHFMLAVDRGIQMQATQKPGARTKLSVVSKNENNGTDDADT